MRRARVAASWPLWLFVQVSRVLCRHKFWEYEDGRVEFTDEDGREHSFASHAEYAESEVSLHQRCGSELVNREQFATFPWTLPDDLGNSLHDSGSKQDCTMTSNTAHAKYAFSGGNKHVYRIPTVLHVVVNSNVQGNTNHPSYLSEQCLRDGIEMVNNDLRAVPSWTVGGKSATTNSVDSGIELELTTVDSNGDRALVPLLLEHSVLQRPARSSDIGHLHRSDLHAPREEHFQRHHQCC